MNINLLFSKMNGGNQLRGTSLPAPRFRTGPLSDGLFHVNGYKHLQTFFPTLTKLFRLGKWNGGEIWMDTRWRITGLDCSGTTGPCKVTLETNSVAAPAETTPETKTVDAFLKTTHLLSPIHWIRGEYCLPKENGLPWHHKGWQKAWQKLQDPGNQAYIDAVASYALGRLREEDISPHFNTFYGSFCARADTYRYNLTEDFGSYRYERWFWKGYNKDLFKIKVINSEEPDVPVSQEIMDEVLEQYEEPDKDGSDSSETLEGEEVNSEEASIHSADSIEDMEYAEEEDGSEENGSDSDEDEDEDETYTIYAEIPNYPVMLILSEKNDGTMESLLDSEEDVGANLNTPEWEARWSAWLFQIVAALSCAQTLFGLTHNDLHTNNILWSKTDQEFLVYTTRTGNVFKVPTYGKMFRIIDFGRAIFTINKHQFISDDFKNGNDAEGQYVFSPLCQKVVKEIPPNPSFDLCRLAVSLLDGIFPVKPKDKKHGKILSKENGLIVKETESELYNLLWSWMIDDNGCNIFINPDGTERFPTFDLYKHIAEFIHTAIPSQQIFAKIFVPFHVDAADVPSGTKKYSLMC